MSELRITDLGAIDAVETADVIHVVDTSDTTSTVDGTSKRATISQVKTALEIPSTTSDLAEGTNLYYTDARVAANSAVAANTAKRSYPTGDETKLATIETGATADQTAVEIKTAYESNADTNAYTDAEKSKLTGIEAGAQVNTVVPADIADFETTTELNARDTANRDRANHTGTQAASTISDFQATVSANTDVTANEARSISTMSTGIIFGGTLSINGGDATKIDIAAGAGYVVDDTVTPATITYVEWDAFTAVTLTDLATEFSTDIAINSAGAVVQQRSYTNTELRSNIFLGGVDHAGGAVNNVFSVQVPSFAPALSVRDFARAVGDLNLSGNTYRANGANLNIDKTVGSVFSFGRNTATSKNDPHTISPAAQTALSFNYIFRNGTGGVTVGASTDVINPLNFDDGSGTLATVAVNKFAFHNILYFPNSNNTFIQYGTTTYNSLSEAINGLATTTFPTLPGFTSAMRRGVIIVKRGTTELNDVADAQFFVADKYGSIAGSVGTGADAGGDMLASVYDPAGGARQVAFQDELGGSFTVATAEELNTGEDNTKGATPLGLQDSRYRQVHYGDTDTTVADGDLLIDDTEEEIVESEVGDIFLISTTFTQWGVLDDEPIDRFTVPAGKVFVLGRLELTPKTGSADEDFSLSLYDDSDTSEIASTTSSFIPTTQTASSIGATVSLRLTNATASAKTASVRLIGRFI